MFPLPENEAERLQELARLRPDEWGYCAMLEKVCALTSRLVATPVSLVSLVGADKQKFAAKVGLDVTETSRDVSFCTHTIMTPQPFIIEDAAQDQRFANNLLVTDAPKIRAYAGVPLESAPGLRVGTLCAIDRKPRKFTSKQIGILKDLGEIATSILSAQRKSLELDDEIAIRRKREQELWQAAHTDTLTGAANLKALRNIATRKLTPQGLKRGLAFILIDLDHFKLINDQWGHQEGDAYLCNVVRKLKSSVRRTDLVARIGGDEFAVLLSNLDGREAPISDIVERIRTNLASIALESAKPHFGRASIGVALAPEHGTALDDLHRNADHALYESKSAGRNTYRIYKQEMLAHVARETQEKDTVRAAIHEHRLIPYYQPKVDLKSGRPIGLEALARLDDKVRGVLTPAQFHFAFQDEELGPALTQAMLTRIAQDLRTWHSAGLPIANVAVNVTPADLMDTRFTDRFLDLLVRNNLPFDAISIEVTETVVMGNRGGQLFNSLKFLREVGVSVALDDFGTGYAGLQHLRDWPIDQIKIDRGFVLGSLRNGHDKVIVDSIVRLGNALNLRVVAEGIETEEHRQMLRDLKCDFGQGFLFAKPMRFEDVTAYFDRAALA